MIRATISAMLWTGTAVCLLVTMFRAATTPHEVDIVPLALCFAAMMVFTLTAGRTRR